MPETLASRPEFAELLTAEIQRVLQDPVFASAPVQTRLLKFLASRSCDSAPAPSQFEIAVNGLGRDENFDLTSDSYPRVQVSRLKKNLEAYYSRVQGGDDLCIFMRNGDYKLRLAPLARAYPDLHDRIASKARPADSPSVYEPTIRELAALGGPPARGSHHPAGSPPSIAAPAADDATRRWLSAVIIVLIGIVIAAGIWLKPLRPAIETPTIDLKVIAAESLAPDYVRSVESSAVAELANTPLVELVDNGEPDYVLTIALDRSAAGQTLADLRLADKTGRRIYHDTVAERENDNSHLLLRAELNGLVMLNGPIGRIAATAAAGRTSTDYECHLAAMQIQNRTTMRTALDACIADYPSSRLRAEWLAIRGYLNYIANVQAGTPVKADGPAWADISAALQADNVNAFANFVAAKVQVANGNCSLAENLVSRALARGRSNQSLYVAATATISGCPALATPERTDQLKALIAQSATVQPLEQANLMLAEIALNDRAQAKAAAQLVAVGAAGSDLWKDNEVLRNALLIPGYSASHKAEIGTVIDRYIWNEQGRATAKQRLAAWT